MLPDTMNNLVKGTLGGVGIVLLILAVICIVPALFVWTVNAIATAGGSAFQLEHSMWNYFLALLFLVLVRGGKS
jgi:hypothetical protein